MLAEWFKKDIEQINRWKKIDPNALEKAIMEVEDGHLFIIGDTASLKLIEKQYRPFSSTEIELPEFPCTEALRYLTAKAIDEKLFQKTREVYDKYLMYLSSLEKELDEEEITEYYTSIIDYVIREILKKFSQYRT